MTQQPDVSNSLVPEAPDEFAVWWYRRRQAIHRWLRERSLPLAELYLGASQLLSTRMPGWTRFVAHAMREIVNRLPPAICGEEMSKGRLEYQRIEALAILWEAQRASSGLVESEIDLSGTDVKVLDPPVWEEIDQFMRDYRDASTRNRERALRMLRALVPESPPGTKQLAWTAGRWVDLGRWANGQAHDAARRDDERDATEFISQFHTLEEILLAVTRPFFDNKDDLDALLEDTNS